MTSMSEKAQRNRLMPSFITKSSPLGDSPAPAGEEQPPAEEAVSNLTTTNEVNKKAKQRINNRVKKKVKKRSQMRPTRWIDSQSIL
jgi:hypothetical protein